MPSASTSRKKRVRAWTSEERAAHSVFEKSRREAFNASMIQLARQIPSLANTRRLNKHLIVDHSIARHKSQRRLCISTARTVQALIAERGKLLVEVNQWRSASGLPLAPRQAVPVRQHLHELMTVESETFGKFPNGFGDNVPENAVENGQIDEEEEEEEEEEEAEELSANTAPAAEEETALFSIDYIPPSIMEDLSTKLNMPLPSGCFLGSNANCRLTYPFGQNNAMDELDSLQQSSIHGAHEDTTTITTTTSVPTPLGTTPTHQQT